MGIVRVIHLLKIFIVQFLKFKKKKEFVGHLQKRLSCRFRNLKKNEKGLNRKGKLANAITDDLQNYYSIAILQNEDNLADIQAAVKTCLFLVASSKDDNYHFSHCPQDKDCWFA